MKVGRFLLVLVELVVILGLLQGCGSEEDHVDVTNNVPEVRGQPDYGGTVDYSNGVYTFGSSLEDCSLPHPRCNKVLVSYVQGKLLAGTVTTYKMYLTVLQYNLEDPPDWLVVFQDWVRLGQDITVGNRPITTLEIKSYGQDLYLRHKDSSFQFSGVGTQRNNGELLIEQGVVYEVALRITTGYGGGEGRVKLVVNGSVISDVRYQTKKLNSKGSAVTEFGIYHNKFYNTEKDPLKQVVIQVSDFKIL